MSSCVFSPSLPRSIMQEGISAWRGRAYRGISTRQTLISLSCAVKGTRKIHGGGEEEEEQKWASDLSCYCTHLSSIHPSKCKVWKEIEREREREREAPNKQPSELRAQLACTLPQTRTLSGRRCCRLVEIVALRGRRILGKYLLRSSMSGSQPRSCPGPSLSPGSMHMRAPVATDMACPAVPCMPKNAIRGGFAPPALRALSQPELSCVLSGPNAPALMNCWRGHSDVIGVNGMGKTLAGAGRLEA